MLKLLEANSSLNQSSGIFGLGVFPWSPCSLKIKILIGIDTLLPPIISCAMFMLVASFTQRISPPKFEVLKTALTDDELITGQF